MSTLPQLAFCCFAPLGTFPQEDLPPLYEVLAFASVGTPTAMAAGDLDGDGRLDLVTASLAEDGLEIRYQAADLVVSSAVFVGAGQGYRTIDVIDLNGDGHLDLLACQAGTMGLLTSFLGDGNGSFQELTGPLLGGVASALAIGDLDLDGKLDLAIALTDTSQVQVALGAGDGSFASLRTHVIPLGVQDVKLGDLDGDGILDMVTAGGPAGAVAILRGLASGDFGEPEVHPALGSEALQLGDIDGDGDLDAVVATRRTKLVVLENVAGNFLPFRRYDARFASKGLDLVDQDGDGDLDVILALSDTDHRYSNQAFSVLVGDGAGAFVRGPGQGASLQGDHVDAVLALDFDGDAAQDVLTLGAGRGTVALFRGNGTGGYLDQVVTNFPTFSAGARAILAGDFNGDGFDDLVAVNGGKTHLSWITLSNGDGTFPFGVRTTTGLVQAFAPPLDLDGDGNLDLAFADRFGGASVGFALGDGAGGFGAATRVQMALNLEHITMVDWNGDGGLDLVGVSSETVGVVGRYGDGAGGFLGQTGFDVFIGSSLSDIANADLDGDGDGDLAVISPAQGLLILLFGDGAGGVQSRVDLPLGNPLFTNVRLADLNRDGSVDVVTGGPGAHEVALRYGTTPGEFAAPVLLPSNPAELLELDDLDRDGWIDLIVFSTLRLGVHRSDGLGGFHSPQYHDAGGRLFDITTGDIDGDGWPEILMAGGRNKVSYLKGLGVFSARLGLRNGSGTNAEALIPANRPVMGTDWEITIDASVVPNATMAALMITNRGSVPVSTAYGELLIGFGPQGALLLAELQPVLPGKTNDFAMPLPQDPAMLGLRLSAQGMLAADRVHLTNAVDGVLGSR